MESTKVIFRLWNDQVIALFPELPSQNRYHCMSYMHIGQHGDCDPMAIIHDSRLAKETEYSDLKRELESIGYVLDVRSRYTYEMMRNRKNNRKDAMK